MKLMPQEVEVRYILPAIRKEFATELKKKSQFDKQINAAIMRNMVRRQHPELIQEEKVQRVNVNFVGGFNKT